MVMAPVKERQDGHSGTRWWRGRCDQRLVSGQSGPQGNPAGAAGRGGAGDQPCQRRPDLPRLCGTLGGARHSPQGRQMAAAKTCAFHGAPDLGSFPAALDAEDVRQLHPGSLCHQQGTHGAPRRIQPRLHEDAARRAGTGLRRTPARHLAAVSKRDPARCQQTGYRGAGRVWRPLSVTGCQWL